MRHTKWACRTSIKYQAEDAGILKKYIKMHEALIWADVLYYTNDRSVSYFIVAIIIYHWLSM